MTNQAIILVKPEKNKDLLFRKLNGKIFIHYQINYLAENLFQKVVIAEPEGSTSIKAFLAEQYQGVHLQYMNYSEECSETKILADAFELVDESYAFVFDAHHYFRLNLPKADDFRRMRDTKFLHIGKKADESFQPDWIHFELDEKGMIHNITDQNSKQEADTFYSGSWLIQKSFFLKQISSLNLNLLEVLRLRIKENREFCLACRQYFAIISSENDLENLENDIKDYYYQ